MNYADYFVEWINVDFTFEPTVILGVLPTLIDCAFECLQRVDFVCKTFQYDSTQNCSLYSTAIDPNNATHLIWNMPNSNFYALKGIFMVYMKYFHLCTSHYL